MGLVKLVGTLKSKLARSMKMVTRINRGEKIKISDYEDDCSQNYGKVEKSESTRMELRSRKARKLIEETLRVADSPSRRSVPI